MPATADAPLPSEGFPGFYCQSFGICPTRLFESDAGGVHLVGRIPTGSDTSCDDVNGPACVAAPSSQAGIGAAARGYSQQMVSRDGRRILFQVPANAESGAIYLREDGTRTAELAEHGQLWAASADGSRAFFITGDSLLPADTDSNRDLYMYDADAPANARLTLISTSATANDGTVGTVIGASDDGHYVYFVCDGQQVAGEPQQTSSASTSGTTAPCGLSEWAKTPSRRK